MAMLRQLELSPDLVRGKRVLDIGCGTGAVAIVCSTLGAMEVIASDKDRACIKLATFNASVNLDAPNDTPVKFVQHKWGSGTSFGALFDVILCADVMYDEDLFPSLAKDLTRLSTESCRIVMVYPSRPEANTGKMFKPNLDQQGSALPLSALREVFFKMLNTSNVEQRP